MEFFSKGLKNEFKIAVANEPSVFKPLKVYYTGIVLKMEQLCFTRQRYVQKCSWNGKMLTLIRLLLILNSHSFTDREFLNFKQ